MTQNFVVRGPDERFHEFKQINNGGWEHWSHAPEGIHIREDGGMIFNLQQVRDYIDSLSGFGPITEDEVKWVRLHARKGQVLDGVDWSQETKEPDADPSRVKTRPQFQCEKCGGWFEQESKRRLSWEAFPEGKGYCIECHAKRIRGMG